MNNDQFVRYKALDRCFRAEHGNYDMDTLVEVCTKAVQMHHGDYERQVSRSTVEHDLTELKLRYSIRFDPTLKRGKKKLYRYEDTTYSLMNELLADGTLEQMLLQNVLDTLTLYDDVPQYKWLKVFMQQQMAGHKAEVTQSVSFQNNPDLLGMEHFDVLLDAIMQHQPLRLEYKPFSKEAYFSVIHPYLLKQYNDRWFLIARTDGYDSITNIGLDRIVSIAKAAVPYVPVDIDLQEYFEDCIGVSVHTERPIEDVLIRIDKARYNYVKTKPIHGSQKEVHAMEDENTCVIKLHLQTNNELEAKILSLGNDAEVLAPEELRNRMKQKVADMSKMYGSEENKSN